MSRPGSGGIASGEHAAIARRERLRQLALESMDVSNDPYIVQNHLGSYECRLCLTLHKTEANYVSHTQGKRHQTNLAKRKAQEEAKRMGVSDPEAYHAQLAKKGGVSAAAAAQRRKAIEAKRAKLAAMPRIGRPAFKAAKLFDADAQQHGFLFQIAYPKIAKGFQPRHRFMSFFEQSVEPHDSRYQYVLFSAEPYEVIAFKVPNAPLDKREGKFFTHWDRERLVFTLQLQFLKGRSSQQQQQQQQQPQQGQQPPPPPPT